MPPALVIRLGFNRLMQIFNLFTKLLSRDGQSLIRFFQNKPYQISLVENLRVGAKKHSNCSDIDLSFTLQDSFAS